MYKSVAFFNAKGGCCKTTGVFHCAGVLAKRGKKVLIVDLDKQRNASYTFLMENPNYCEETSYNVLDYFQGKSRIETCIYKSYFKSRENSKAKYYNIDILPADVRLEDESQLTNVQIKEDFHKFLKRKHYDWVLIDMPPSNKSINHICFQQISDHIIIPFTSDHFSVIGLKDVIDTIHIARSENPNLNILGIYLSRFSSGVSIDMHIKKVLSENFTDLFIDIQIPNRVDIREGTFLGRPISFFKVFSESKKAYENLIDEMEKRINLFNS